MEAAAHSVGDTLLVESGSWTHVHMDSLSQIMEDEKTIQDLSTLEVNTEW